jgi:ribosomal protein S6--L-glutamate ligase
LGVAAVVTKQDHLHCGHGIRQWRSIEDLYSHLALADDSYPFALQPSLQKFDDVRVVMVEDYTEAYQRCNPHNFRKNISCGAHGLPYKLDAEQTEFCRSAMRRAKFPYAHLDLLISEEGTCRLSEISLNGGLRGAAIRREELERMKKRCLTKLAEQLSKQV